jgi:hypothetical protein
LDWGQKVWTNQVDLANEELQIDYEEKHSDSTFYDAKTGDSIRYKFDAYYSYKCNRVTDTVFMVKNNNIHSICFDYIMSSEDTTQIGNKKDIQTFKATSHIRFGKNVGMINILSEDFEGKGENQRLELIDYYINK